MEFQRRQADDDKEEWRMDSATHLLMGISLGGLAFLDPYVASNPAISHGILVATMIGSEIPDIDTISKLKNNAVYIRHHRGITHSLPAIVIWPILIMLSLYPLFPEAGPLRLWFWASVAVATHVLADLFNAYGTQAFRPFSAKRVALGWINTFDPILFAILFSGVLLWFFHFHPVKVFPVVFSGAIVYYAIRFFLRSLLRKSIEKTIPGEKKIILCPTLRFFQWRIAAETETKLFVGIGFFKHWHILDEFVRKPYPNFRL